MQNSPLPVAQQVAQPVQPRRNPIILWIFLIIGVLVIGFLVCAGIIGSVAFSLSKASTETSSRVDLLFEDINAGNFGAVYETKFADGYRKVVSPEQHAAIGEACRQSLGKLKSKSTHSLHTRNINGTSCIVAIYNCQFEKGQAFVNVTLQWEEGDWRFLGFRVQSPKLAETMKCPSCGGPHSLDAKFCPKCGKALGEKN
jgi:hypothetical protein